MNPPALPSSLLVAFGGLVAACQSPAMPEAPPDLGPSNALVAARPYDYKVPDSYDGQRAVPVVLVLHGYGATGAAQDAYFGLSQLGQQAGFITAYPDGLVDSSGSHYWNATDACCDFNKRQVDDVAYLGAVLDDLMAHYKIDGKRVFVVGHSNGGFMSYRLACDLSARIAGIASLAGLNWKDPARCKPQDMVSVLQIHGDMDDTVSYTATPNTPSALESAAFWAARGGCAMAPDTGAPDTDQDRAVPGAETAITRFTSCQRGGAELWRLRGSGHIPLPQPGFARAIYEFLSAHPKP